MQGFLKWLQISVVVTIVVLAIATALGQRTTRV